MKKLLAYLFLLPVSAVAQETYSISASANQVTQLDRDRARVNRAVCEGRGLVSSCTQGQVCTAAGVTGGSSCTAVNARAAGVRIYPATQAGREEFVTFDVTIPAFQERTRRASASEQKASCDWFTVQSTTVKDAECTKWGLAATWVTSGVGCNPCE